MLSLITPEKLITNIANKAKAMRLACNLSRKTLSAKSGVPESSIRHFEDTGQISLLSLTKIALVLDAMSEFNHLFDEKPLVKLEDFLSEKRKRGRE